MSAYVWLCLAWSAVMVALIGLTAWGDLRAEKYFDDLDARVAKLRADRLTNGDGL